MLTDRDPELVRRYGRLLMIGASLGAAAYAFGLARRSYLALALPMSAIVGATLSGVILLGRLLATTPDEPPDPS